MKRDVREGQNRLVNQMKSNSVPFRMDSRAKEVGSGAIRRGEEEGVCWLMNLLEKITMHPAAAKWVIKSPRNQLREASTVPPASSFLVAPRVSFIGGCIATWLDAVLRGSSG